MEKNEREIKRKKGREKNGKKDTESLKNCAPCVAPRRPVSEQRVVMAASVPENDGM